MVLLRRVTSADGAVVTGQLRVAKIVYCAALAADTVVIQDNAGNTIFQANGNAATSTQTFDFSDGGGLFFLNGHKVSTISASDVLLIYG
jgi:hypothetical protein